VPLRWTQRLGPAQIAPRVGLAASTVPAILVRCRISRLASLDRATASRSAATSTPPRSSGRISRNHNPLVGQGCIHAAVDDHSRLAYAEIHTGETSHTAAEFLQRAQAWFAARGVVIQQVLTDNGSCYRSHRWHQVCQQLGITAKHTRHYRPQTNGKVERFNRTLVEGWAYRRLYVSEQARRAAFGPWLHWYNHHRPHSALGGRPPITRCTNLPEPYT
jgi:transposase InsO family protein